MRYKLVAVIVILLLAVALPTVAGPITLIDTKPLDGFGNACCIGFPDVATMGQIFVAGPETTLLNTFSFWLESNRGLPVEPNPLQFSAYILPWNCGLASCFGGGAAYGQVLYQSSSVTLDPTPGYHMVTFDTGGVTLQNGQIYVAFLSTVGFGPVATSAFFGLADPPATVGDFVFQNSHSVTDFTGAAWSHDSSRDAAFQATFTAVPEPGTVAFVGSGLALVLGRRRMHRRLS